MLNRIFLYFLTLCFFVSKAQEPVSYSLSVALSVEKKEVSVVQKIRLDRAVIKSDTLYFNDWNHAYSSAKTPLAKRFAEEFDRSFYLSGKNRLGLTKIEEIRFNNSPLIWFRCQEHPDIIGIVLPESWRGDVLPLNLSYTLTLPDARFTGYGFKENDQSFSLSDWMLTYIGPIESRKDFVSNLNLDDAKLLPAQYTLRMIPPPSYQVVSDLARRSDSLWEGRMIGSPKFRIQNKNNFFAHLLADGTQVFSNIKYAKQSRESSKEQFQRIYSFLKNEFPFQNTHHFLVTKEDYNERPFYGLNQLPSLISPFSKDLLNELKIIKAFARTYVQSQWYLDKRKQHWLLEGIPVLLVIKYMETYYPDLRFLGILSDIFYLRTYGIAKMKFNEGFMTYTEFMLRNNLLQQANSTKDELTRFNERIAIPYHVGIGFRYLESYLGKKTFKQLMEQLKESKNPVDIQNTFAQSTSDSLGWFLDTYVRSNWTTDFSLKYTKKGNDSISLRLSEKKNMHIPVKLSFFKEKNTVSEQWIVSDQERSWDFAVDGVDQVAINPVIGLPELNKENNWKKISGSFLKKPVSLKFVKDIEVPERNQLFVNPISNYNAYDGIAFGMRLHNKKLTRQNFQLDIRPQYSFLENNMVGSFGFDARFNSPERKNYLTMLSVSGASYHYANSLRYNVLAPRLTFLFRTPDFRSNIRQAVSASWYNISKDLATGVATSPEYGVFKLQHLYSDKAAINYLTLATDFEIANSFSKVSFNLDFRKLFPSGRQLQARFFVGKFLWNSKDNDGFFDFGLTRPNDYLYQYQFLGRSETTGIYSQQFILAEGGLKSAIDHPFVSDYLISTNLMASVWKWIELYGDVALSKNFNQSINYYWGAGVRVNLVPDYLELYFPVYTHNGFALNDYAYAQSLRFVLTIQPKQLATLFTRKWF